MSESKSHKNSKNGLSNIKKKVEYQAFINAIGKGEIPDTWQLMAEALGVTPQTITQWKKLPEFRKALAQGIKRSADKMEVVGKRDWRMWRERLAILSKENKNNDMQTNVQVNIATSIKGDMNDYADE